MGLKTKEAANSKKKNRASEMTEPDDVQVTQPSATHEVLQRRAYEIYLSRGATDARDMEDWLQAERDLSRPRE